MNRKILMMKAVPAAAACLLLFAFYRKGGNGGLYYFLIVSAIFFAVGRLEEYGNRKAVASFHARKEAAYIWMGQNLTGNRIADLKLIRKQFGLTLAAAVEVLNEYRKTEGRQSGKAV